MKQLLRFWHENGDKVLIFSHSVKLLKMLEHLFHNTTYNVSFLSGSMPNEDRQKTVDEFNSDPNQFVFLISTKAGGVGLNITSANKVVIFDPNWNPSYDLQAQDRAYRIGQLRDVEVFRLVSAGTVEEIVYARQIYKQQQANIGYTASTERRYFEGIQNSPSQRGELFGLANLLTFHEDSVVVRDIVHKTNVAEAKRSLNINMLSFSIDDAINDEDNPLAAPLDNDASEDGAMSQLAALLIEGDKKKSKRMKEKEKPKLKADAIQAILSAAGVEYTHENSEVIGSSRVEAELSRRAEEAGGDVSYGERKLFAESQSQSQSQSRNQVATLPSRDGQDDDAVDGSEDHVMPKYLFHPSEEVMKRQFCTMAKMWGFENATEFAVVVEGWTQVQRRDCLDRFYALRRKDLVGKGRGMEVEESRRRQKGEEQEEDKDDDDDDEL